MSKIRIYFDNASDLTSNVSWAFNPDKNLAPNHALRHVRFTQVNDVRGELLSYCAGDVWLCKFCPSQGPIGTTYIFDAEDLVSRVKAKAWQRRALSLSATKRNKLCVEAISFVNEEGKVAAAGNIEINCYGGDLLDFTEPETESWQNFGSIFDGWELRKCIAYTNFFSGLKTDKTDKSVWLRFQGGRLTICSTEKGSNLGSSMLACDLPAFSPEKSFGINGKYFTYISDVFNESQLITVELDDLEAPTRARFVGDAGWVDVPITDEDMIKELSQGAVGLFYGEGLQLTEQCDRTFNLCELNDSISIQAPKKSATYNDVLLQMIDNQMVISKLWDVQKFEVSSADMWTLEGRGEWKPVSIDFNFMTACLDCLDKYVTRCIKDAEREEVNHALEFEELNEELEFEGVTATKVAKTVTLTQKSCITSLGRQRWYVFVEHPEYKGLRMLLGCSVPEELEDKHEDS